MEKTELNKFRSVVRMEVYPTQGQFPGINIQKMGCAVGPKTKMYKRHRVACRLIEVWG